MKKEKFVPAVVEIPALPMLPSLFPSHVLSPRLCRCGQPATADGRCGRDECPARRRLNWSTLIKVLP